MSKPSEADRAAAQEIDKGDRHGEDETRNLAINWMAEIISRHMAAERAAADALLASAKEIQEQMRARGLMAFEPIRGRFFKAIEVLKEARK